MKIGIVIPTLESRYHLRRCLPPLLESPLNPEILIVDSSSLDGTALLAERLGAKVHVIPRSDFNHGLTRERARCMLDVDIIVMMTPDAYAQDHHMLEKLIAPIVEGKAECAYARQMPHQRSTFFAAFPREFNYPETSHIRGIEDQQTHGSYLYFCSNSCAAYKMDALDAIGGFKSVLLGEDTLAAAQLLQKGYHIAYVAEAIVHHSHSYSLKEEFRRYFDTGLAREEYRQWIATVEQDSSRGKALLAAMLKRLILERPYLIPYALMSGATKWFGYKLGQRSMNAPLWMKKLFSAHRAYWA